jgi:hypothetical protein
MTFDPLHDYANHMIAPPVKDAVCECPRLRARWRDASAGARGRGAARRRAEDAGGPVSPWRRVTAAPEAPVVLGGAEGDGDSGMSDQLRDHFIIGPNGGYWGSNRGGYYCDIAYAGLYTQAEAEEIEAGRRGDRKVHILDRTEDIVSAQRVHDKACEAAGVLLETARDIAKHSGSKVGRRTISNRPKLFSLLRLEWIRPGDFRVASPGGTGQSCNHEFRGFSRARAA